MDNYDKIVFNATTKTPCVNFDHPDPSFDSCVEKPPCDENFWCSTSGDSVCTQKCSMKEDKYILLLLWISSEFLKKL